MDARRGATARTRRGSPRRVSLPWLLCQVALALIAREVRRPVRRPRGADLFIWPAMIAVAAGFLLLLAQWSGLLAVLIALALLVAAWRGWH